MASTGPRTALLALCLTLTPNNIYKLWERWVTRASNWNGDAINDLPAKVSDVGGRAMILVFLVKSVERADSIDVSGS